MTWSPGKSPKASGPIVVWRIAAGVLALNLFVFGVVGVTLARSQSQYLRIAEISSKNLSSVLEEDLTRFVDKVDLTLLDVTEEIEREDAVGGLNPAVLTAFIARHDRRLPEALGVRVFDAQGRLTFAAKDVATPNGSVAGSDPFRHWRETDDRGLYISKPMIGEISAKPIIAMARRLTNAGGGFAGQVDVSVGLDGLERMFAVVQVGDRGSVTLSDRNATVIARVPNPGGPAALVSNPVILPTLRAAITARQTSGSYHARSAVDNIERTYFFHKLATQDLYLLVGLADDDILAGWWREVGHMVALSGLFTIITAVGGVLGYRGWAQRNRFIQELARKEAALKMFRETIDKSNDAILIVDLETSAILDFNQTACDQLGRTRDEMRGLSLCDIDPALPDIPSWHRVIENIPQRSDGSSVMLERTHVRPDGTSFPVEVSWRTTVVDGRALGISIERNIAERKDAELAMLAKAAELERSNIALTQSNADLERFAYVASHDLQTPLRSVISYTQLLERRYRGRLDDDADEFITFIVDAAKRMSRQILDLLEYARITSLDAPLLVVSADQAVRLALANLRSEVAESGAEVSIAPLPAVLADEIQLVSVFQNLIGNAIKYRHPDRSPVIAVTAEPGPTGYWQIAVADNGIGIEPQYFGKIFEIFQRLHPPGTIEGTGIGLPLCQRIVRRFGGEIWLDSVPTEGSVFRFTLRASPAPPPCRHQGNVPGPE